jgi:hypothetical protein
MIKLLLITYALLASASAQTSTQEPAKPQPPKTCAPAAPKPGLFDRVSQQVKKTAKKVVEGQAAKIDRKVATATKGVDPGAQDATHAALNEPCK